MSISENKNDLSYMSDKSLKDIGISRKLWEDWYMVMNILFNNFNRDFNGITNKENALFIKDYEITARFVNSSYIEVCVNKKDMELLSVRLTDNMNEIGAIVLLTIGKNIKDLLKKK
jgi:hypothetical protein